MKLLLKKEALNNLLPIILAFYFYLNLLPSNTIYLSVIPGIRTIFFILLCILFSIIYGDAWTRNNKFIFIFMGGFIITNFICLVTHEEFLIPDFQYIIQVLLIFIFCSLPFKLQIRSFNLIVKFGAILLFCGILEFILYTYFDLSYLLVDTMERGEGSTQMYAHGIFNVFQLVIYHILITKILLKPLHIILISAIGVILLITFWDILNDAIFLRTQDYLEYGDNRTTVDLDRELNRMFSSSDLWFGYGYSKFIDNGYTFGNGGIKAELFKYGLINVCLFILFFYILLYSYSLTLKQKLFLLFLYALCSYNGDAKYAFHIYVILLSLYQHESITFNSSYIKSNIQ